MAAPIVDAARPAAAISMAALRQSGRRSDGCVLSSASFPSGWRQLSFETGLRDLSTRTSEAR